VERYYGFDDSILSPSHNTSCFGPGSDCTALCEYYAIELSINGQTPLMGSVEVCERVPAPEGWADAGYQGWADAGYLAVTVSDGGVDPNRILHVVVRLVPFCGT